MIQGIRWTLHIQGAQLYMAVLFWYLVKFVLTNVRCCTAKTKFYKVPEQGLVYLVGLYISFSKLTSNGYILRNFWSWYHLNQSFFEWQIFPVLKKKFSVQKTIVFRCKIKYEEKFPVQKQKYCTCGKWRQNETLELKRELFKPIVSSPARLRPPDNEGLSRICLFFVASSSLPLVSWLQTGGQGLTGGRGSLPSGQ